MDHAGAMHPHTQNLDVLELGIGHVLLHHLPVGRRGGAGIGHEERQFKDLGRREAPGRVPDHVPGDVDHPVDDLVDQFRGLAAQLHRGESLDLDTAAGGLLDLVRPDIYDLARDRGLRGQEALQVEAEIGGPRRPGR